MKGKLLIYTIVSLTLASCSKEVSEDFIPYGQADSTWQPTVSIGAPANQLFSLFPEAPYVAGFKSENGGVFKINNQLELHVPANAFVKNGSPLNGVVEIKLTSYLSKGQLLATGLSTATKDSLLEAAGSFYVQFLHNNEPVNLADSVWIKIRLNSAPYNLNNCHIYTKPPLTANFELPEWQPASDGSYVTVTTPPSQFVNTQSFDLYIRKAGWVSCQQLLHQPGVEKLRANVVLPLQFTHSNTTVFAVFKNNHTIIKLKSDPANKLFYSDHMPAGAEVRFISVSFVNNEIFVGDLLTPIVKAQLIKPKPVSMSKQQLQALLSAL